MTAKSFLKSEDLLLAYATKASVGQLRQGLQESTHA